MKIIIDTHVFLWAVYEPEKLSHKMKQELESLSNIIYVSSITLVEIMIKSSIGKLDVDKNENWVEVAEISGFEWLDFNKDDAMTLNAMPLHHKDPFDRMLIAQAINNNYRMMSKDSNFCLYDCHLV